MTDEPPARLLKGRTLPLIIRRGERNGGLLYKALVESCRQPPPPHQALDCPSIIPVLLSDHHRPPQDYSALAASTVARHLFRQNGRPFIIKEGSAAEQDPEEVAGANRGGAGCWDDRSAHLFSVAHQGFGVLLKCVLFYIYTVFHELFVIFETWASCAVRAIFALGSCLTRLAREVEQA